MSRPQRIGVACAIIVALFGAWPSASTRAAPGAPAVVRRVAAAVAIIDRGQFDRVVTNPFLVSALYYSEKAIAELRDSKAEPARIVAGIHSHLTLEFRQNYLAWLDETAGKPGAEAEPLGLPLAKFSYVWKMARGHRDAIDLMTQEGTPVLSMSRGIVVLAENGWRPGDDLSTSSEMGGNTVIIYDPDRRTFFRYAHLQRSIVKAGAEVSRGERIGFVGHTGKHAMRRGHGKHLHLEMNRWDAESGAMIATRAPELKELLDLLRRT